MKKPEWTMYIGFKCKHLLCEEYRDNLKKALSDMESYYKSILSEEEIAEAIPYRCTVVMNKKMRMLIAKAIYNKIQEAS